MTTSSATFEKIAREALASIPAPFADYLGGIVFRVEEWPSDELIDYFGLRNRYELTGVYQGRPLTERSIEESGTEPDRITLFRQPLLAEQEQTGVDMRALIRHVVVHEVGHHFGLSDDDMHALEDSVED